MLCASSTFDTYCKSLSFSQSSFADVSFRPKRLAFGTTVIRAEDSGEDGTVAHSAMVDPDSKTAKQVQTSALASS